MVVRRANIDKNSLLRPKVYDEEKYMHKCLTTVTSALSVDI